MERFAISTFEKNKVNAEYIFRAPDGRTVRQREYPERREYLEETQDPKSPFSTVKVFYMDSGNIKINGERFYTASIGTWQYFYPDGRLERQVNWDAPFRFTVNDLISKVKADYKIDLMQNDPQVDVDRNDPDDDDEDERPQYIVSFPVGPQSPGRIYIIWIDGINGKEVAKHIKTAKH